MREVVLSPDAVRQFRSLRAAGQRTLPNAMKAQLERADPARPTRNRFRLRRPSPHADFELRLGRLRVFYRILGDRVLVVLIGEKRGNRLLVEGSEFIL